MRKLSLAFVAAAFIATSIVNLYAGTLAGVTLPDSAQAGATTLVLNGMGLRNKYMIKVYVAGLYLPQKSSDANAILKADAPKRLVMHFVRGVSKNQLTDGFSEGFERNSPNARNSLKTEIERFFGALDSVKDGDELVFTYVPGTGTSLEIGGSERLIIGGSAFAEMLLSVWIGPKPPNESLKSGLLGT